MEENSPIHVLLWYLFERQKAERYLEEEEEFQSHKLGVLQLAKTAEQEGDPQVAKVKRRRPAGSQESGHKKVLYCSVRGKV